MVRGVGSNSAADTLADDIVPSGPNNKRSHSEMVQDSGNGSSGLDSSSAVTAPIIVQQQRDTDADAAVQAPPTSRARLSSGGPQSHLNQYDPHKGDGLAHGSSASSHVTTGSGRSTKANKIGNRWYIGRMAEDGMRFSAELLYPHTNPLFKPSSNSLGGTSSSGSNGLPAGAVVADSFGYSAFDKPTTQARFPLSRITTLGHLTNPLRRVSVIEKWSPLEMALFESAMFTHGKRFHDVQRYVKTKSIKDVVAFYYSWKKTAGYKSWKQQYIADVRTHPHMVALGDHDAATTPGAEGGETSNVSVKTDAPPV